MPHPDRQLIPVTISIPTRDGTFRAGYSCLGLATLSFPGSHEVSFPSAVSPPPWHELTVRALQAILEGNNPEGLPPLDLSSGTTFQQNVWGLLLKIPSGQTRTYGELALDLQKPGGARAVGLACGANPIPVLIPCHRVVAAGQGLGGFSGGLDWKRKLLGREGAQVFLL